MEINETKVKNIIVKSNLPDTDYVINPYTGCMHNCIYCYACFMRRFTGHQKKWGQFVDIKVNGPDLVPENTDRYQNKKILLSSVTDPYLPIEKEYKVTRRILENLINLEPKLNIQTKSDLVLRDMDLLKQFKECEIGFTIITLDEKAKNELEKNTVSIKRRIDALKILKEQGFKTYVFIGPIFPYITDWQDIIEKTSEFTDFYMLENLKLRGSIYSEVDQWLNDQHPNLKSKYKDIFRNKNSNYWQNGKQKIENYLNQQNIEGKIYFEH